MSDPTQPPQHGGTPRTDVVAGFLSALSTQTSEQFVLADFARTLERELNEATTFADEETARYNKMSEKEAEARRLLTAALDEKREVEAQKDREWKAHWETQVILKALRTRLALVEELASAADKAASKLHERMYLEEALNLRVALRRWAESRTEGTNLGGDGNDTGPKLPNNTRDVTPAIPSEPASRAVPIAPETVVPLPCWLRDSCDSRWIHVNTTDQQMSHDTFYHPDQPTPPTSRPT